jgi:excisionase family DNA binding protein
MLDDEPLTLTIPQAARLLRIGRTKCFEMARSGEIPGVIRFGRAYRISKPALLRWLGAQPVGNANSHGQQPAGARPDEV